jgi:hypothetical protein
MPRLHEIDERLRAANVLITGIDYDVLTKRVHFTINPVAEWRDQVGGTAVVMEDILKDIPGEVIITDEKRDDVAFNAADDFKSLITITYTHSYLMVDGKYRQELGDFAQAYLRA